MLSLRRVAEHAIYPIRLQTPRPSHEVIGKQRGEERERRNTKGNEEERDVSMSEGRGKPEKEENGDVEDGGEQGRQEEQVGRVGELSGQLG